MNIYGIHGTFFQANEEFGIEHAPESEGGAHVVVHEFAMSHLFSGHFSFDEAEDWGEGNMIDMFGPSRMDVTTMTDKMLVFEKYYQHRTPIRYDLLREEDGTWSGRYHSPEAGGGEVRCRIDELPEEMFNIKPKEEVS